MKRVIPFLIIIGFFLSLESFGQKRIDPIKKRFPGGEQGFMGFLMKSIIYPDSSTIKNSIGLSIARISLSASGTITDVRIINPIDKYIDQEVIRVIKISEKKWKAVKESDSAQVLYIQIAFTFYGITPHYCDSKTSIYESLFLQPVVITCFQIIQRKENEILDDTTLTDSCNRLLNIGKYSDALQVLNELIKRDPFNKELYKVRIVVNSKLGKNDLVIKDNNLVNNYAEQYSLEEVKGGN